MQKIIIGLMLSLLFIGVASAADTIGTASVEVLSPIAIAETQALNFGNISPTGTAGTVAISTGGVRSNSNVDLLGGLPTQAIFAITGAGNAAFSVSLPSSVILTGPETKTVDSFVHDAGASPALSSGTATVNVGATLNVNATQAPGTYTGTYSVSVNYQ